MEFLVKKILIENEISDHYHEKGFNVKCLAKKLGICESYLREIVHSKFLLSPQQLIETIRLIAGLRLLLDDMRIYEVAIKIGYYNTRSFRRAFKKRFGLTPSQVKTKIKIKYNNRESIRKRIQNQLWG